MRKNVSEGVQVRMGELSGYIAILQLPLLGCLFHIKFMEKMEEN